ncbi:probable 2-oxoglutarate dehydrogenase E1 component DHKTD1, mitochondrial isoform X1 [Stegodyphus dumicola]|uniref:probable 2-oxoglutarate dehydrogenase E1 component DHKTD1, mitochondrial isoform X1 n=1 Tax=Stegodyphus dumicola TaxID=202533 RepID=UPI0015ACBCF2|nr:probable 2-oxoglutarate dehydrogenase E1 component DHKTD1, mitochondrial isoform X1 [Stegodyphus dumicola]
MNRILKSGIKYIKANYHSSVGVYGFRPRKLITLNDGIPQKSKKYFDKVYQIHEAFRNHGHRIACLNPLSVSNNLYIPQLDPENYNFDINSSDTFHLNGNIYCHDSEASVGNITDYLKKIYCDKIGVEIQYLEENEKDWFSREFEKIQVDTNLSESEQKDIAKELIKSQVFDNFLATKFSSVKRYGGEGAESMMVFFMEIFKQACLSDLKYIMIGIPHRGRLNLLTGLLNFPPVAMFQKFFMFQMMGFPEFSNDINATGDVLSHLTSSIDYKFKDGSVHITLLPNPSHLEAVSPVVVGYARSRLQSLKLADYSDTSEEPISYPVLPIQVHGDASFTGQGVVMETIAMSNVAHFSVGGSVHLIVNNQIGFTTPQERGRSSTYCSDLMKTINAPVIHVNGDFPEEVLKAAKLAFNYRQKFHKDVMVDMLCFRRWGHNELDDPTFTNPIMYKVIHSRKSVPDMYSERLIADGILNKDDVNEMISNHHSVLNENLKLTETYKNEATGLQNITNSDRVLKKMISTWNTGISEDLLKFIGAKSVQLPENFVSYFIALEILMT